MSASIKLSQRTMKIDIPVPTDHTYFQGPEDYERLNLKRSIPEVISDLEKGWKYYVYNEARNDSVIAYWYKQVDFPVAFKKFLQSDSPFKFETIQKRLFEHYKQEMSDREYLKSFKYERMGRIALFLGFNRLNF